MDSLQQNLEIQPNIFAQAIGRRKEAVAKVQLISGNGEFIINNKSAQIYLQNHSRSILAIKSPFEVLQTLNNSIQLDQFNTIVKVEGGGLVGQAEAIKLAVARAVCQLSQQTDGFSNIEVKKSLKTKGLLTVDARVKERRKYGLKKARKASQYHKR